MADSCSGSCGMGSAQVDCIDLVSSRNDASEESEDIEEEMHKHVAKNPMSSILDKLKLTTPADINWLRKTKTNRAPPRGKRRCHGDLASDPKQ